jgi:hypothetical protein
MEKTIKHQSPFIYQQDFVQRLKGMNSRVSQILLDFITTGFNPELINGTFPNFLEIKNDNQIYYVSNKKSEEFLILIKRDNQTTEDWIKMCWSKNRQQSRPAKLITLIFNIEGIKFYNIKEKEINEFVNEWSKFLKDDKTFDIIKGKDIQFWYNNMNYARPTTTEYSGSTLWRSCMADSSKNKFMEFYTLNSQISLLILKDNDNKIWGRALLIESDGYKIMDRIYYINETVMEKFRDWARKEGFIYKTRQAHDYYQTFFVMENKKEIEKKLEINFSIDKIVKNNFPYVDTFWYLYPEKLKMANYLSEKIDGRVYELRNPGGGFTDKGWCTHNKNWQNFGDLRRCEITDKMYRYDLITNFGDKSVYKDLVVPSKLLKKNVLKTEAVKVLFDNDWVTNDDVYYSKFHHGHILRTKSIPHPKDKTDWIHTSKMVYSDIYKEHILMGEDVIKTVDQHWMYEKDCKKINGLWFNKKEVVSIVDEPTNKEIFVSKKHLDENKQLKKSYRSIYFDYEVINDFRSSISKLNFREISELYTKK